jgi:hypothetical protein
MKSVFYIITLYKRRYVACIEMEDGSVITTTPDLWYQRVKDNRILNQARTIKELL